MTSWRVSGPQGSRKARSWPQAFDMLCQDIKSSWMADGRMGERAAELQTWAEVEYLAEREPCTVTIFGKAHRIERAP